MRLAAALALLVAACGGAGDSSGPDGELDCEPPHWSIAVDLAAGGGERTPFDAMQAFADLAWDGAEVHVVSARTATVVIAGAEIGEMTVEELADETFAVGAAAGCGGFEP